MKKHLLFAALLTAVAGTTQAQITLTAATHMPQAGSGYYMAFDDTSATPVMPTMGANQTWNYSGVIPVGFDTLQYFNCVPQANCASFNNANLLSGSPTDTFYQYFKTGANVFQSTGGKTPEFTLKFANNNPLDVYRYPFTYNDQFNDAATGTATASFQGTNVTLNVDAKDTVKATGYGTLITPLDTFQNVLQVRSIVSIKATLLFQTFAEIEVKQYEWFVAGSRFPVMTYLDNTTTISGQTDRFVGGTYQMSAPSSVRNVSAAETFQLVPNPATGVTQLQIPQAFGANATVVITDISGKGVFKAAAGTQPVITIHTADWAKGIYLVRVQSASGEALMQKLSVQ